MRNGGPLKRCKFLAGSLGSLGEGFYFSALKSGSVPLLTLL